uniref:WAPL domain-containing protein n=1 Tax=Cynoglossus semilaevis TaxID=244447 RepID=A0A3P8UI28_CYNSE
MDLDRSCLDLMIRLLELDQDQDQGSGAVADSSAQFSAREIAKMKERIRKLCDTVHNKHLDLQNITTGHLAMETLLSLTSKRAGDWFKEELRLLGGLDHIIDKVKECVDNLNQEDEEKLGSSLWGAERCLRVLESVTVHHPENQNYLIAYKDSSLIISSARALRRCEQLIRRYNREVNSGGAVVGKAVENCMRAVIGVLLNLTHDNEWGSTKTGEQEDLMITALNCVLRVPQFLPQEQRFDICVLVSLSHTHAHAHTHTHTRPQMIDRAGGELRWGANDNHTADKQEDKKQEEEDGELDLNKALQHAGKHMEDSIVASYTALLLGCLCQASPMNVTTVRQNLPKGDFSIMTEMLKKFLNFMNLTCDVGTTGQKSISKIIDYLEDC